jgi:hypothetical protein
MTTYFFNRSFLSTKNPPPNIQRNRFEAARNTDTQCHTQASGQSIEDLLAIFSDQTMLFVELEVSIKTTDENHGEEEAEKSPWS